MSAARATHWGLLRETIRRLDTEPGATSYEVSWWVLSEARLALATVDMLDAEITRLRATVHSIAEAVS